jgi:DNA-binding cell septation regulator SpoVG
MKNSISEVQITPIKPIDGLVGFASLVFDDSFYLGSIGIFTRPQGGFRLTYPTRKSMNKNLHVFHPINKEIADDIERAIISKFEEVQGPFKQRRN